MDRMITQQNLVAVPEIAPMVKQLDSLEATKLQQKKNLNDESVSVSCFF